MRIGMFTDSYLPDINGVVTSVVTLKNVLEAHGHEVWIVSNHPSIMKTEYDYINHEIRLPGLEIKKLYGYKASVPFHTKTMKEIAKLNWDLVHAHSEFGVGIFGRLVSKSLHLPLVSTYHTTYEDYTHYVNVLQMDSIDKFAKKVIGKLSKLYGETSNAVIAPSKKTKDMLLGYGITTPIYIVPTGLDLKRFAPTNNDQEMIKQKRLSYGVKAEDTLVIFVGRIAQEKSITMLIEAFIKIPTANNNIKLMIVGSGPDYDAMQQMINDHQLNDRVFMVGKQFPEQIPLFYHMGDVFVSASLTETQGLTYIEALASGIPVLARPDGAVDNLIIEDQNGYFFKNVDELAKVIINFSKLDQQKRQQLAANGLIKALEYDVEVFYQEITRVYSDTIKHYNDEYKITDIDYKDDTVKLTLVNAINEMNILITVDSFADYGLRKDKYVNKELISELLSDELMVFAYKGAIKYLTTKDRTSKEMRSWFSDNTNLHDSQINQLMASLIRKKYLDDRRYAQSQINRLLSQLMGKHRIKRELLSKGITIDIINEFIVDTDNQQLQMAIAYAKKQQNKIKDRSLAYKQSQIKNKLIQYGYDVSIANEALSYLDVVKDEANEKVILRKMAQKAKTRYNRKYSGSQLRNHIYRYLTSQGFNYDDIYLVINEMEWEDE